MGLGSDFYGMLGIAVKARACIFGFEALLKGIRSGKVFLALVDEGASFRSKKTISKRRIKT